MIDRKDLVKQKPEPTDGSQSPWMAFILVAALAWFVWSGGYLDRFIPDQIIQKETYSQVLFVIDESMSDEQDAAVSSLKVDEYCSDAGVERRVLMVGQDVSGSDPWLKEMVEIGYGQAPCLVFRSESGKLDCVPIPDGIDATIQEIQERI